MEKKTSGWISSIVSYLAFWLGRAGTMVPQLRQLPGAIFVGIWGANLGVPGQDLYKYLKIPTIHFYLGFNLKEKKILPRLIFDTIQYDRMRLTLGLRKQSTLINLIQTSLTM